MKLEQKGALLVVTKESGDPQFSGTLNAAGESRLLYHIKNKLNNDPGVVGCPEGTRFIKKRMWKDGHLVSDLQQYIRTSKPVNTLGCLAFFNNHWAICGLDDDFREGSAILSGEWL